jgi:protein PhnA
VTYPTAQPADSPYTYQDRNQLVCPKYAHEWSQDHINDAGAMSIIKDSNEDLLANGYTVSVIKDLKIKGSTSVVKVGTKVKNMRLVKPRLFGSSIHFSVFLRSPFQEGLDLNFSLSIVDRKVPRHLNLKTCTIPPRLHLYCLSAYINPAIQTS